ncbi:hypothetical protein B0H13DRAFT_1850228 [Mycena leptocephala]|nr:hypothetical protein B0H13DRAFT_1850228 [Mycena leptocephala]
MSVLVDGVQTALVVISPLLHQTSLSAAFVSSHPGFTLTSPSSVTIAVDCGPIKSLSTRLPCAVSLEQPAAVSLRIDWISSSVHKWYLDHGFMLPMDGFGLQDLLYPTLLALPVVDAAATVVDPAVRSNPSAFTSAVVTPLNILQLRIH